MTTTPTPASQPSPARSDNDAERVKKIIMHAASRWGSPVPGDLAATMAAEILAAKAQESAPSSDSIGDDNGFCDLITELDAAHEQVGGDASKKAWAALVRYIHDWFARRATAGTTAPVEAPGHKDCYCGGWTDDTGDYHQQGCPEIDAGTTAAPSEPVAWRVGRAVYPDKEKAVRVGEQWSRPVESLCLCATAGNAAPDYLHNAIMNLPNGKELANFEGHPNTRLAYKIGHRDARHAAAELASNTARQYQRKVDEKIIARRDARIAELEGAGNTATAAPGDLTARFLALSAEYEAKRLAADNPNIERIYLGAREAYSDAALIASNAGAAPGKQIAHGHRDDWYLMANARRIGMMPIRQVANMTNWNFAHELFATGSNSSHQICVDAGIDPAGYTVERAPSNPPVGAEEKGNE